MANEENHEVEKGEWMLKLYEEAWRQYNHEDNLVQTRTKIFLLIQGLAASVLVAVTPLFAPWTEPMAWIGELRIGLIILGAVLFLTWLVLRRLLGLLDKATMAEQQYVNLRWATIRAIEESLKDVCGANLGIEEARWRKASSKATADRKHKDDFAPFPDILKDKDEDGRPATRLYYYNNSGSLMTFRAINRLTVLVWRCIAALGVVLIVFAVLRSIIS